MSGARSTPREWQQARLVGAAIRASRQRAGLTQIELAARLTEFGRPWLQGNVSHIERGRSRLLVSTFVDISRALGREPGRLLTQALKAEEAQQPEPEALT